VRGSHPRSGTWLSRSGHRFDDNAWKHSRLVAERTAWRADCIARAGARERVVYDGTLPKKSVMTDTDRVLANGGEAGELARSIDWSRTAIGPVEGWSQALRSTVALILHNHSGLLLWWGPELIQIYNDAYRPVLGDKHPRSMGQPVSECWSEIWHIIGPMIEAPFRGGPASVSDDLLLPLRRKSFIEETHFQVAYSPVPDDTVPGTGIGGVLATVTETTEQKYAERQLRTLRELGARGAAEARTAEAACAAAAATLADDPWDVPFALFYLLDDAGVRARRVASVGFDDASLARAAPAEADLAVDAGPWPLREVAADRRIALVSGLAHCGDALPHSPWAEPPREAIALPLASPDQPIAYGVLICGISPHRVLDAGYRTFLELAAARVVTAIRNARALEQERKRAEALAEIDRAKTAFFSNVSHEFRTPLTLMLGPTEDALALAEPALRGADLETVYRNELRLLKLVNALLDFSRIEAGRMRASYAPTDIAARTAELASVFRSAVERAGLHYRVDCEPIDEPVHLDGDMWEKIVLNLLSNALKFTFTGAIDVRLVRRGDEVALTVKDTGVGIPAGELPRLFERFHRVAGARARTYEGSGIGLALVNDLIRLHGGRVEVTSEVGVGTAFTVVVPTGHRHLDPERIAAAPAARPSRGATEAFVQEALRWMPDGDAPGRSATAVPGVVTDPAPDGPRDRVLVADDNADMREYITRLLCAHWDVEAVDDGEAALAAARKNPPELVLTDVMMPRLDGFGLLAALRRDPATRSIPVVMLSARAGEESRIEGLQAGADDYLVKPFSARELIARVETHLELRRVRDAAARERDQLLRRERDARLEAERANRAKDEFLAVVSHELRTPLNAMMGWARLLLDGGLPADRLQHGLEVIERNAQTQAQLIDDLLDVSRIISGKVRIDPRPTRPIGFVEAAIESVRLAASAKGVRLQLALDSDAGDILGDRDRLQQVVWNLLSNAIKFTPTGGSVFVGLARANAGVEICVEDTGRGIRPEFMPHVFERFRQADASFTRALGGLGLGLAIARHLVELHGGTIDVHSDGEGRGARFTVRLPIGTGPRRADSEPGASAASEPGPRSRSPQLDLGGLEVLVVDDEQDGRDVITEILERAHARVTVAASAAEALDVLGRLRPAVLVSDIGMPDEDGFTLMRKVRALPEHRGGRVPAVALTAYARAVDRQQAMMAGYDVHLGKPVDPGELVDVVAGLAARGAAATG
jgi:signal transduction histidine kinase